MTLNHPKRFGTALLATFLLSSLWLFAQRLLELRPVTDPLAQPSMLGTVLVELICNSILSGSLLYLRRRVPVATWQQGVRLALVLWFGFPVILLTGSVFYERVPVGLAAIHGGEWLLKLVVLTLVLRVGHSDH